MAKKIYKFRYSVNTRAESIPGGEEGTIVSILSITIRTADEGGRYGCNASNSRGSHAHHGRLNVFGMYQQQYNISYKTDHFGVSSKHFIVFSRTSKYQILTSDSRKNGHRCDVVLSIFRISYKVRRILNANEYINDALPV